MSDSREQAARELARAMGAGTIEPVQTTTTITRAEHAVPDEALVSRLQQAVTAFGIEDEAPRLTVAAESEEASSSAQVDLELEELLSRAFDSPDTDSEMDVLLDDWMNQARRRQDGDLEQLICAITASRDMANSGGPPTNADILSSTRRASYTAGNAFEPPTVSTAASVATELAESSDRPVPQLEPVSEASHSRRPDAATDVVASGTFQGNMEFGRPMHQTRAQTLVMEATDARIAALEQLDRSNRVLSASAHGVEVAVSRLRAMMSGALQEPGHVENSMFRDRLSNIDIEAEDDYDDAESVSSSEQWAQALQRASIRDRAQAVSSRRSSTASSELSIPLPAAADILLSPPSSPSLSSSTDDDCPAMLLNHLHLLPPIQNLRIPSPQESPPPPTSHPSHSIPLLTAQISVLDRLPTHMNQHEIAQTYDTLSVAESVQFCYFLRSWGYETSVRLVPGRRMVVLGLFVGEGNGWGNWEYVC
ncbi:MAG: hypothetical protein M1830_010647 [Pleopsidium flavum]|nr:MAG: hypothetical protein M1830_010647 [Pleopsidium flavum]